MTTSGDESAGLRVAAVVLAGGKSSRFGRDKATEPFEGSTLVERAVLVARSVARDVVVVAAAEQALPAALPARVVRDAEAFPGPLVAFARGVGALEPDFDVVLAIAVDLPRLSGDVLGALVRACPSGGAAVPQLAGALQPLTAAYSSRALEGLRACVAGGARSMHAFLDRIPVTIVDAATLASDPQVAASDPELRSLSDADTPAALERLRRP